MENKRNLTLLAGGISGFLAVALGAFGAHALRAELSPQALGWWQTAVEYHLAHAVVLVAVAWAPGASRHRVAAWAFGLGTLLFSGSLYAMALTGFTWLGFVTPLGGVSFLVGWGCLVLSGLRK